MTPKDAHPLNHHFPQKTPCRPPIGDGITSLGRLERQKPVLGSEVFYLNLAAVEAVAGATRGLARSLLPRSRKPTGFFPTLPLLSEAWHPIVKWIWKITRLPDNALKPNGAGKPSSKRKGSLATERRALALLDAAIVLYWRSNVNITQNAG
jgi:hypothetical protein